MGVGGGEAPWPERGRPQVGEKSSVPLSPATSALPLASAFPHEAVCLGFPELCAQIPHLLTRQV